MRQAALLTGTFLLVACRLQGQTVSPSPGIATGRLVEAYMKEQRVPRASVAIVLHDRLVYARGFGWANLGDSVPVTTRTLFPTASTLKVITATAVLQLVEQGKMQLDQPIQTYCPAYPRKPWPVTIAQLLVHQGGVRPSVGAEAHDADGPGSVRDRAGPGQTADP